MKAHDLVQGSTEWLSHRIGHFNASDAPAMMGVSPYKSRTQLLHEKHTGITPEVNAITQQLFDDGHRYEALAREYAESIVGEELYPATGSDRELGASFDGLTMMHDIAWEHKTLNSEIRSANSVDDLGLHYRIQMEQQLLVSGADRCLFLATKWGMDDEMLEEKHFWYESDAKLRAEIIAGWGQFKKDLAEYQPKELVEKPKADAILMLPALAVHIRGEVTASNLPEFKAAAEQFIARINTDLKTDDDFANAEATVKFCDKAEKELELAKKSAIAQTASIDELMRTVDFIKDQLRTKRLSLSKLIETKKDSIKADIINAARLALVDHVASLEAEIEPIRMQLNTPDFAGALKNKRTLVSLHDAADTVLAQAKIEADAAAKDFRAKLNWHKENADGYQFLFADMQQIIGKPMDDFQLLAKTRITEHKANEDAKAARLAEKVQALPPQVETLAIGVNGSVPSPNDSPMPALIGRPPARVEQLIDYTAAIAEILVIAIDNTLSDKNARLRITAIARECSIAEKQAA